MTMKVIDPMDPLHEAVDRMTLEEKMEAFLPKSNSASNLPEAPKRTEFESEEEFEEALGYWRSHVGRIKAMADLAARSKRAAL